MLLWMTALSSGSQLRPPRLDQPRRGGACLGRGRFVWRDSGESRGEPGISRGKNLIKI